jgi:hypothetical protein
MAGALLCLEAPTAANLRALAGRMAQLLDCMGQEPEIRAYLKALI